MQTRKITKRASTTAIGPMGKNSQHVKHFMPEKVAFDLPQKITNANAGKGTLSLEHEWRNSAIRPGCNAHNKFKSFGTPC